MLDNATVNRVADLLVADLLVADLLIQYLNVTHRLAGHTHLFHHQNRALLDIKISMRINILIYEMQSSDEAAERQMTRWTSKLFWSQNTPLEGRLTRCSC